MKFPIKKFFSKCDQIRRNLWNWLHLLKKSLMENFIFCAVYKIKQDFHFWNLLTVDHVRNEYTKKLRTAI